MNNIHTVLSKPTTLAAAITLAAAGVAALTMPTPAPTPTAEPSGDTTPGLTVTPAAQYNEICPAIGSVPGDPEPTSCTRIPVTVTAAYDTSTEVTR